MHEREGLADERHLIKHLQIFCIHSLKARVTLQSNVLEGCSLAALAATDLRRLL